jgi:hypothetical protein
MIFLGKNRLTFNIENLNVTLYKNDCNISGSFHRNTYWDIDTLQKLKKYIGIIRLLVGLVELMIY